MLPIIITHMLWLIAYNVAYCIRGSDAILNDFRELIYQIIVQIDVQATFLTFYTMLINNYFRSDDLVCLFNCLHGILHRQSQITRGENWKTIFALVFTFLADFVFAFCWQLWITGATQNWIAIILIVGFSVITVWSDMYLILFIKIMMVVQGKFRELKSQIQKSCSEKEVSMLFRTYFQILSLNRLITRALMAPILMWILWTFMECTLQLYIACDYMIYKETKHEATTEAVGSLLVIVSILAKLSVTMLQIGATHEEVIVFFSLQYLT